MDAVAPADIIQDFAEVIPEAEFFYFPGMPEKVPDSAIFQYTVEKALSKATTSFPPRRGEEIRASDRLKCAVEL